MRVNEEQWWSIAGRLDGHDRPPSLGLGVVVQVVGETGNGWGSEQHRKRDRVETEFSLVRFDQDKDKAATVYRGMTPLTGQDIGECIAWVATRPSHVNIDEMVIRPRDQATATMVHRGGDD